MAYRNNLKNRFLTASALPQDSCLQSRLASGNGRSFQTKNSEEPLCQNSDSSGCFGISKIFPFLIALLATCHGFCQEVYSIKPHKGWTSTRFEIQTNGEWMGDVEKSALGLHTHYNLTNGWGRYGTSTARLLSWGSVRNCWKEFDVYDEGKYGLLGTIRRVSGNGYPGRFEICDWDGHVYATAIADLERGIVEVIQAGNPNNMHLHFQAEYDENGELYWTYTKVNRWFNIQTMHAFAAILADYFPPTNACVSEDISLNK